MTDILKLRNDENNDLGMNVRSFSFSRTSTHRFTEIIKAGIEVTEFD